MDGYALHFRTLQFESILKRRDYKVHLLHGQIIGERAMAGKINVLGGVHIHIYNPFWHVSIIVPVNCR